MDIEEVAARTPEKIIREPIHPLLGLQPYQSRKLAKKLGLRTRPNSGAATSSSARFTSLYLKSDCSWSRSTRWS